MDTTVREHIERLEKRRDLLNAQVNGGKQHGTGAIRSKPSFAPFSQHSSLIAMHLCILRVRYMKDQTLFTGEYMLAIPLLRCGRKIHSTTSNPLRVSTGGGPACLRAGKMQQRLQHRPDQHPTPLPALAFIVPRHRCFLCGVTCATTQATTIGLLIRQI
jgi:hypothetical protein